MEQRRERLLTRNFAALFLCTFFMFFATDFFIPVLPFYIVQAGGTGATVGLLMGLFTFSSVVLRPYQGRRLNRSGRKKLLLLGIAVYILGGLGLTFLPSLPVFFLYRILQGFGWGAFLLAFNTLTVDLAPFGRKGEAVGLIGIAPPLSLATAPLLGETMRGGSGAFAPVFMIPVIMALIALTLSLALREPALEQSNEKQTAFFTPKVLIPSVMIFFITFSFGAVITFLPMFGEARELPYIGLFFTVFAVTSIIVRPLSGKLSDRLGRAFVFLPGLVVLSLSLAVISMAFSREMILLGALLFGCGMSSTHPTILALAADSLSPGERGVGMANFTMAFDAGIAAGAIISGVLLNWIGFTQIFLICAVSALLPLAFYLYKKQGNAQ